MIRLKKTHAQTKHKANFWPHCFYVLCLKPIANGCVPLSRSMDMTHTYAVVVCVEFPFLKRYQAAQDDLASNVNSCSCLPLVLA